MSESQYNFPIIETPPSEPHTHTVIFLHGRGDTAVNFEDALHHPRDARHRTLFDEFLSFRWVFPQAPIHGTSFGSQDYVFQWFDTWDISRPHEREELQIPGLKMVVPALRRLILLEASKLDWRFERILLAGLSMGAATCVHTLLNLDIPPKAGGRLGAVMGFCGRLPFAGQGRTLKDIRDILGLEEVPSDNSVICNTPVLLQHCADDDVTAIDTGRQVRDTLREFGAQVTWNEYPDGLHWINYPLGLGDIIAFLHSHVL